MNPIWLIINNIILAGSYWRFALPVNRVGHQFTVDGGSTYHTAELYCGDQNDIKKRCGDAGLAPREKRTMFCANGKILGSALGLLWVWLFKHLIIIQINGSVEPIIHHNALATRVKVMARRVRISTTKINLRNQTNKRKSKIIPTEMDNQLVHMVLVEPKVERLQPNIRKINIKYKQLRIKNIPTHFFVRFIVLRSFQLNTS